MRLPGIFGANRWIPSLEEFVSSESPSSLVPKQRKEQFKQVKQIAKNLEKLPQKNSLRSELFFGMELPVHYGTSNWLPSKNLPSNIDTRTAAKKYEQAAVNTFDALNDLSRFLLGSNSRLTIPTFPLIFNQQLGSRSLERTYKKAQSAVIDFWDKEAKLRKELNEYSNQFTHGEKPSPSQVESFQNTSQIITKILDKPLSDLLSLKSNGHEGKTLQNHIGGLTLDMNLLGFANLGKLNVVELAELADNPHALSTQHQDPFGILERIANEQQKELDARAGGSNSSVLQVELAQKQESLAELRQFISFYQYLPLQSTSFYDAERARAIAEGEKSLIDLHQALSRISHESTEAPTTIEAFHSWLGLPAARYVSAQTLNKSQYFRNLTNPLSSIETLAHELGYPSGRELLAQNPEIALDQALDKIPVENRKLFLLDMLPELSDELKKKVEGILGTGDWQTSNSLIDALECASADLLAEYESFQRDRTYKENLPGDVRTVLEQQRVLGVNPCIQYISELAKQTMQAADRTIRALCQSEYQKLFETLIGQKATVSPLTQEWATLSQQQSSVLTREEVRSLMDEYIVQAALGAIRGQNPVTPTMKSAHAALDRTTEELASPLVHFHEQIDSAEPLREVLRKRGFYQGQLPPLIDEALSTGQLLSFQKLNGLTSAMQYAKLREQLEGATDIAAQTIEKEMSIPVLKQMMEGATPKTQSSQVIFQQANNTNSNDYPHLLRRPGQDALRENLIHSQEASQKVLDYHDKRLAQVPDPEIPLMIGGENFTILPKQLLTHILQTAREMASADLETSQLGTSIMSGLRTSTETILTPLSAELGAALSIAKPSLQEATAYQTLWQNQRKDFEPDSLAPNKIISQGLFNDTLPDAIAEQLGKALTTEEYLSRLSQAIHPTGHAQTPSATSRISTANTQINNSNSSNTTIQTVAASTTSSTQLVNQAAQQVVPIIELAELGDELERELEAIEEKEKRSKAEKAQAKEEAKLKQPTAEASSQVQLTTHNAPPTTEEQQTSIDEMIEVLKQYEKPTTEGSSATGQTNIPAPEEAAPSAQLKAPDSMQLAGKPEITPQQTNHNLTTKEINSDPEIDAETQEIFAILDRQLEESKRNSSKVTTTQDEESGLDSETLQALDDALREADGEVVDSVIGILDSILDGSHPSQLVETRPDLSNLSQLKQSPLWEPEAVGLEWENNREMSA